MSWILPEEFENEERFQQELAQEKEQATKFLMDSGLVKTVEFTTCMIPLQMKVYLPTGEWCYARNARVGGDVTLYIFDKWYDLATAWPDHYITLIESADAWTYVDMAEKMIPMIKRYYHEQNNRTP